MDKPTERKKLIQSIERALDILEVVRDSKNPLRSVDIARAMALSPAAASNIIRTLFIRGYLDQDDKGHYALGSQAYLLSSSADSWGALRAAANEPMLALSRETGNLAFLGVESNFQIIAVNIAEGTGPLVVPKNQDWLDQFHSTAAGKILLALMKSERYALLKEDYKLRRLTERTISKWEVLERELEEIRTSGHAIAHDESVFGITSIAVPVYSRGRTPLAALALSFSSYYFTPEFKERALKRLRASAKRISASYDAVVKMNQ